jgi:hypothetical protein
MLRNIMVALIAIAAIGVVAIPTDVSARGGHGGSHGGYRGGHSGGYYGGYRGYGLGYSAYPYPYYSDPYYYDSYSYGPPPAAQYESGPAYVAPGPGPNGSGYNGPPPATGERGPANAAPGPGPGPNGSGRQCWVSTDKDRGLGYFRPC